MTPLAAAVREVEESFPTAVLQPEIAFGGGTTYLSASGFISGAQDKTWRMLDASFLDDHHDALLFLTSEAFVAFLPAYLVACAHGGPEIRNLPAFLRGVLDRTRDSQWFDARFAPLSATQQRAIARLLVELERASSSRRDKEEGCAAAVNAERNALEAELVDAGGAASAAPGDARGAPPLSAP